MITVLVGHRGTGKSTYLRGVKQWALDHSLPVNTFDLDYELEAATGRSTAELFSAGEGRFRALERETFARLVEHWSDSGAPTVIAVGGGFEAPPLPGLRVVWLRRTTDAAGRSFVSRPRLNTELSPMAEYHERFVPREKRFAALAHEELTLPEGYVGGLEEFLFAPQWKVNADLTLIPENFRDWPAFCQKRRAWGIRYWELRDDLLTTQQLQLALRTLPARNILFSRRQVDQVMPTPPSETLTDWALELGAPTEEVFSISLHQRQEDFTSTLRHLEPWGPSAQVLKLAVEVKDFSELRAGHHWWQQDPARRSFLPRSPKGRWQWYRALCGPAMPMHFLREGDGSAADQPLLWQALLQPRLRRRFAALLGDPIAHSRSPSEQHLFFKDRDMPIVAIAVAPQEFGEAMEFLRELGLSHAAVTAPLKKLAWAYATQTSVQARELHAANTLYLSPTGVWAHNTDVLALEVLRATLPDVSKVWLWGGGGVKSSVRAVWPQVREIAARQGTDRKDPSDLVIWATGRGRPFTWPAPEIRPRLVLDLNYSDDSPGLEWAVRENLPYQSGLKMFKLQAEFQRQFWASFETGDKP